MKKFLLFLLLCTSLAAADPQPIAIDDPAWQPLFTALAAKGPVFATFTEHRHSKLRKIPTVLDGEMRLAPGHGLSLLYIKTERLMIIDEQGILLRDAAGRTRELPDNANAALLPVLRFDLPALAQLFELKGAREGADWRIEFIPRDTAQKSLLVTGRDETVTSLEFHPTASQRIEITITATRTGVPFSSSELTQFFRQ
jgi:hypothetical protein